MTIIIPTSQEFYENKDKISEAVYTGRFVVRDLVFRTNNMHLYSIQRFINLWTV